MNLDNPMFRETEPHLKKEIDTYVADLWETNKIFDMNVDQFVSNLPDDVVYNLIAASALDNAESKGFLHDLMYFDANEIALRTVAVALQKISEEEFKTMFVADIMAYYEKYVKGELRDKLLSIIDGWENDQFTG